jgi:phage tail tape-measure protein
LGRLKILRNQQNSIWTTARSIMSILKNTKGGNLLSRKSMIMLGMLIGSTAGGYVPALFGVNVFSVTSLLGSTAGGILGIWLAFKLSG